MLCGDKKQTFTSSGIRQHTTEVNIRTPEYELFYIVSLNLFQTYIVARRTAKRRVTHLPESSMEESVIVAMIGLLNSRWLNKILSAIWHALGTIPKFVAGVGG